HHPWRCGRASHCDVVDLGAYLVHPSRCALPSHLVSIGFTKGPVFAAPFFSWVIGMGGWRWAFGALGIIGLVWIVSWLVLGSDGPYRQGSGDKSATDATDATDANSAEGSAVVEEAAAEEETETDKVDDQKPVNIWRAL